MTYYLFVDDEREPHFEECYCDLDLPWIIVRNTREAKKVVSQKGYMPTKMALDHDLGLDPVTFKHDTIMDFLKWLEQYFDDAPPPPDYSIHTANSAGGRNIYAFMESWWKSRSL